MPATLGTITTAEVSSGTLHAILKDYFLTPIQDELNREVMALELFQKATVKWSGLQAIIPVRVGRNTGVGFRAESGTLPTAGAQDRVRLSLGAKYMYGSFEISGPAIAAAKTAGIGALVSSMEDEMSFLKDDVRDRANRFMFAGARCVGFLNEHIAGGAAYNFEFSGDIEFANDLLVAKGAPVNCLVIRMDTYATILNNTYDAVDTTGSRISFGGALDTTVIAAGNGAAVIVDDAAVFAGATAYGLLANFPEGIYGNLAEPSHFGADRTTAAGKPELQSNVFTMNAAGDHGRASLAAKRMQFVEDEIQVASGLDWDLLLSHPVMRQEYTSLMNSAASLHVDTTAAKKGDLGFTGLTFNGRSWRTSRHCGKGVLVYLKQNTWAIAELAPFQFADLDGNVLSRKANEDTWGGFLRWYYNLCCKNPSANALLVGIQFSGAVDGA
jgi:hypothetical protein